MSKRKDVIRKGDTVRIINPEFFISCGYPLSLRDTMAEVMNSENDDKQKLIDFANHFNIERGSKFFGQLLSMAAYRVLCKKGFGGRERKIYTIRIEEAKGHEFEVLNRRVVTTGTYHPMSVHRTWEETEYEAPFLEDSTPHVLYELQDGSVDGEYFYVNNVLHRREPDDKWEVPVFSGRLEIEKCNVEKVFVKNKEKEREYPDYEEDEACFDTRGRLSK